MAALGQDPVFADAIEPSGEQFPLITLWPFSHARLKDRFMSVMLGRSEAHN